jgi:serine/threonine-protein kinase
MSEREIFETALAFADDAERSAYLDRVCASNPALKERIEGLLDMHGKLGNFLEAPACDLVATEESPALVERPGTIIGPYKLLEQIGEGGFGIVFMAEQQYPVRRKVALKVLKPGMDTRQIVARFEAERQALALMDHPSIAHVLDGGETSSGRPYFVMELVRGLPITDFCDRERLAPQDRLKLFISVCHAVQHAHQKGIIHRDIKPGNLLVTLDDGVPVVKIIDFGIAKAMGQQLTDKTLFTGFAQMVGTPLYMSPEQAGLSGSDVDTRSDIYSLGVLLYQLLTGTTPFDQARLREVGYDEIRRIIREEEPPKPSTRLSQLGSPRGPRADSGTRSVPTTLSLASISAQRQTEPAKLTKLVRGELDWIVMKALEKDRNRRYETVGALAADLERYLKNEPVTACPPSAWYHCRKFARRNRAALMMASVITAALAVLACTIGWVAHDRALKEAALASEVSRALDEAEALITDAKCPEAWAPVERAEKLLLASGQQELPPKLQEMKQDLTMAQRLEEIYSLPKSENFPSGQEQDADYARAFRNYGIDVTALPAAEAAERIRARPIRRELARGLDFWSSMRRRAGTKTPPDWKELLDLAREADRDPWRNQVRDALARDDRNALEALASAADVRHLPPDSLTLVGRTLADYLNAPVQAVSLLQQAQRQYPADLWINDALGWYCSTTLKPPQYDEAVRFYAAAQVVRPRSPGRRIALGRALLKKGSSPEAFAQFSKAIEMDPQSVPAWEAQGLAHGEAQQWDKALGDFCKVIELDPQLARGWVNRGIVYSRLGQLDKALDDHSKGIALSPQWAGGWGSRGYIYSRLGKKERAIRDYTKAIELDGQLPFVCNNLAWLLATRQDTARREPKRAAELAQRAVELEPTNGGSWNTAAVAHYRAGNWQESIEAATKSMEFLKGQAESLNTFILAMAHWQLGHREQARTWYDKAVKWMEKNSPKDEEIRRFHAEATALLGIEPHREDAKNAKKEEERTKP